MEEIRSLEKKAINGDYSSVKKLAGLALVDEYDNKKVIQFLMKAVENEREETCNWLSIAIEKTSFHQTYKIFEKLLHNITATSDKEIIVPLYKNILDGEDKEKMKEVYEFTKKFNALYQQKMKEDEELKEYAEFIKKQIIWIKENEILVKEKILYQMPKNK